MPLVVARAEGETADHLKKSQMSTIADLVDVVRADTILDIAVACAVRPLESGFKCLHPRADEERGWIVFGDYVG